MRFLKPSKWDNKSGFGMNTNGVSVNHLSTQKTGDGDQYGCQQREIQTPGIKVICRMIAQQPVERSHRQGRDSQQCMDPGNEQIPDGGYKYQVDQAGKSCQPATQAAQPRQPQADTHPEGIVGVEIGQISTHQSKQKGDREMNQHGMNRMSADGHATDNRFACHGCSPYLRLEKKLLPAHRSLVLFASIIILFFLSGCDGPQSALNPAGPSALAISRLWWGMFGFFTLVLLVMVALWLYALWRKPVSMTKAQARRLSKQWIIGGGIVLPLITMIILLSFSIPIGYRLLPLPLDEQTPLRIEVTARQWFWQFRYADTGVITTNQLHLPTGIPVDIHVSSADVIHSFWVPRLAGKIDVIPGRTNRLRFVADAPGRFRGQCSEFCGLGHADMVFSVEVHTPENFEAWLEGQNNE